MKIRQASSASNDNEFMKCNRTLPREWNWRSYLGKAASHLAPPQAREDWTQLREATAGTKARKGR